MEIEATFIGENSLGYEKGKTYRLYISGLRNIVIKKINGSGICPYVSIITFLDNWSNIKKL